MTELQAGTLDPAIFRDYLIQDAYYLKHFSRLYALIAQQAQESDLKAYAAQSAAGLTEGELAVRRDFFDTLMITDEKWQQLPLRRPPTIMYRICIAN